MSFLDGKCSPDCMDILKNVNSKKQKFGVFKLTKDQEIIPDYKDEEGAENLNSHWLEDKPEDMSELEYFVSVRLPEDATRFAIYNVEIIVEGGYGTSSRDKVMFVSWCPDDAPRKDKMTSASVKNNFKQFLGGFSKEMHADCKGDLEMKEWIDVLKDMNNIKIAGKIIKFEGSDVDY